VSLRKDEIASGQTLTSFAGAAGSPETDKAAIDEAEKRIGAKKED